MPRRPNRSLHVRDWRMTVGTILLRHGKGVALECLVCGHGAVCTPADIAAISRPAEDVWNLKQRMYCSKCRVSGTSDAVAMRLATAVVGQNRAWGYRPALTAPQLWCS
jgi:hypothetical protein